MMHELFFSILAAKLAAYRKYILQRIADKPAAYKNSWAWTQRGSWRLEFQASDHLNK